MDQLSPEMHIMTLLTNFSIMTSVLTDNAYNVSPDGLSHLECYCENKTSQKFSFRRLP